MQKRAPFVKHVDSVSRFLYTMKDQQGTPLDADSTIRIALFSDFGTGEYQSLYVAKALEKSAAHYSIHLGDVYYSGTRSEVQKHLESPLAPVCNRSRVYALNANHEMLSGGFGYFEYLERKRSSGAAVEQEQEGSYFCLRSPRYQVVAVDTAYDYKTDGQLRDVLQQQWLTERLVEARNADPPLVTILLTQHEPFGLGTRDRNVLFDQIEACARREGVWMIDFWFWGDEHYCALFKRKGATVPFVGSCIGNAGHPVDLRKVQAEAARKDPFVEPEWVDLEPRFTRLRADDLGNTGFCVLELRSDGVELVYHNWLGNPIRRFSY
jgi:hypothetical protein